MAEAIAGARKLIELPAPEPLGGGVLSAARVIDVSDAHELMGVEATTDACATAEEWSEWCTTSPVGRKLFEGGPDIVVGDPFAVYAGVECTLQTLDAQRTRAARRLTYAEPRSIDLHVFNELEADAFALGGPFPVGQAIGIAEAFAATVYGGAPTILIPRQFVPCACCGSLRSNLDGTLTSYSGSRIVPLTTPITIPATGANGSLYVTGQITLLRGDVLNIAVPQQPENDGSYSPARALAERIYVPVFDCLVAKVGVSCAEPATP